jgi:hypothetical protein
MSKLEAAETVDISMCGNDDSAASHPAAVLFTEASDTVAALQVKDSHSRSPLT